MQFDEILEIYGILVSASDNNQARKATCALRKQAFNSFNRGLVKLAFDTRRINQETDYIPRRGLQNYHRSESFIPEALGLKIKAFNKLVQVLDQLKIEYGRENAWQDSYTRILCQAVNKGLRTAEADGDFSDSQPSMASLSYLEELMFIRYRLTPDNIFAMSELELRDKLLAKDELLTSEGISKINNIITTGDVSKYSYDAMMEKMLTTMAQVMSMQKPVEKAPDDLTTQLFNIKATKDAPEVERTVTITIKDKIVEGLEKKSSNEIKENIVINSDNDDIVKLEE
jgi:hypothetical protein